MAHCGPCGACDTAASISRLAKKQLKKAIEGDNSRDLTIQAKGRRHPSDSCAPQGAKFGSRSNI
jgi:hypothetical protein